MMMVVLKVLWWHRTGGREWWCRGGIDHLVRGLKVDNGDGLLTVLVGNGVRTMMMA